MVRWFSSVKQLKLWVGNWRSVGPHAPSGWSEEPFELTVLDLSTNYHFVSLSSMNIELQIKVSEGKSAAASFPLKLPSDQVWNRRWSFCGVFFFLSLGFMCQIWPFICYSWPLAFQPRDLAFLPFTTLWWSHIQLLCPRPLELGSSTPDPRKPCDLAVCLRAEATD